MKVLKSSFTFWITDDHVHADSLFLTCLFRSSIILVICIFFLPIFNLFFSSLHNPEIY